MATFYFNKLNNTIRKWNENLSNTCKDFSNNQIKVGDSITIEYKKIRVVTDFHKYRKNKIMILNNIKDKQTKEKAIDSITYYDDDFEYKKCEKGKYFDIGNFDPSKYGNPVCYYNCGYQNNPINIVTRIYKINDSHMLANIVNTFGKIISIGSIVPTYGVFFSIAGQIVQSTENIISKLNENGEKITENHVITFRTDDIEKPFIKGSYLCIPEMDDENEMEEIINKYYVEDNCLLTKEEIIKEYYGNYFIIEVSVGARDDLLDFNFTASSNKLLSSINQNDENGLRDFLESSKNASDSTIIKKITSEYSKLSSEKNPELNAESKTNLVAMYNHIHDKEWFKETFPHIFGELF